MILSLHWWSLNNVFHIVLVRYYQKYTILGMFQQNAIRLNVLVCQTAPVCVSERYEMEPMQCLPLTSWLLGEEEEQRPQ